MQVKNMSEELQSLHALKVELEVANGRLKSMEHFHSRLKVGVFCQCIRSSSGLISRCHVNSIAFTDWTFSHEYRHALAFVCTCYADADETIPQKKVPGRQTCTRTHARTHMQTERNYARALGRGATTTRVPQAIPPGRFRTERL